MNRNDYLPTTQLNTQDLPTISEHTSPITVSTKTIRFGVRHLQCVLLFFGLAVGYAMRVNLSVAILAMTDRNSSNPNFEEFNWSEKTKSYVLSSFFCGYIFTQIPAGQLADKYGPKPLLFYGILISSLLALFTPLLVHLGDWKLLCFVRLLQGLSQGMLFPSTHAVLSKWALIEERGALCGFCYAGTLFGAVIMFGISGILASSCLGWPGIFYVSGSFGFCWILIWYIWGANSPSDFAGVSTAERLLIESSLLPVSNPQRKANIRLKTPWLQIFTTPAVWVLIFVHCAHNWGFWTLLTELPTYMKKILGTDIKINALLTALPYVVMFVLSFVFIAFSNTLAKRHLVSISANRKILNTIGQWIPAMTFVALAYTTAEYFGQAIFLLMVTIGVNAASFSGFQVNHIDLSPNFAGVLMGITNCAANTMSIIAPLVVGLIVTDERDPEQWRSIFFIAAGFYFLANLLFLLFGKTKVQSWNSNPKDNVAHNAELLNLTVVY